MPLGVTVLQRETLEAKAVWRSEHCHGGTERRHEHRSILDSAQRAVQSGGASRSRLENARMRPHCSFGKTMWPRETTAHSGDIEGRDPVATCKANVFGGLKRSAAVVLPRNSRSLWLPARGKCGAGGQSISQANMAVDLIYKTNRWTVRCENEIAADGSDVAPTK